MHARDIYIRVCDSTERLRWEVSQLAGYERKLNKDRPKCAKEDKARAHTHEFSIFPTNSSLTFPARD